jgi:hypothetical protein
MPLKRLIEDHRVVTFRGVEFWMMDQAGVLIFCRVRQDALRAHANRNHFHGTDKMVFDACQDELQKAASEVFDATGGNEAGCIIVTSDSLAQTTRRKSGPKPKGSLKVAKNKLLVRRST